MTQILKKKILKIGKTFDSNENEIKEEELINIVEIAQINKGYVICVLKNNQGISSTYLLDQKEMSPKNNL